MMKIQQPKSCFGHLVFRDCRDNNIIAACIKSESQFVECATCLFRCLLGANKGHLKRESVTVGRLSFNELREMVAFKTANPKSHAATIVVGVNDINCGGDTVLSFNALVVAFNNVTLIKSIKVCLQTVTVRVCSSRRLTKRGFCFCLFQKCFNFRFVFLAHIFTSMFSPASYLLGQSNTYPKGYMKVHIIFFPATTSIVGLTSKSKKTILRFSSKP